MNERMILQFREYSPGKARWLLGLAESFATTYADRRAGDSVVYSQGPAKAEVYWTEARAVVAREVCP